MHKRPTLRAYRGENRANLIFSKNVKKPIASDEKPPLEKVLVEKINLGCVEHIFKFWPKWFFPKLEPGLWSHF